METKKLPRAHVWNHKKWLGRRTIVPFAFRGRYDPNDACEIKFDVMKPSPNFFQAGWSHPIHHSEPLILSQIGWYSMKNGVTPKKSPWARVCDNKKWLVRCATLQVTSLNSYDHLHVCKNKLYYRKTSRKFFRSTQKSLCSSLTSSFWSIFNENYSHGVGKPKNHPELSFGSIKNDWDVAQLCRWLWRIDVIIVMSAKVNLMLWKGFKKILMQVKVTQTTFPNPPFEQIWMNLDENWW